MNTKQIFWFFFAISVASHVQGNPIQKRDVTTGKLSTTLLSSVEPTAMDSSQVQGKDTIEEDVVIHRYQDEIQDTNKAVTDLTDMKATPGQKIIIRAHEEDEIVPSENGVPQGPILYRDLDEVLIEPVGVEYVLDSDDDDDDDLETAATLVFRPYFRYSKKTVRRYPTKKRRTSRPRRPIYYENK